MEAPITKPKDHIKVIEKTASAVADSTSSLTEKIENWLGSYGWLSESAIEWTTLLILLAGLLFTAWIVYIVFRPLVLSWVKHVIARTPFSWDDHLLGHGVFRWITQLLPGIYVTILSPGLFVSAPALAKVIDTAAEVYLLIVTYLIFDSLINAIQSMLQKSRVVEHLNIVALGQVAKLITALVIFLLCIAAVLQQPPLALLSGLGVLASVIMLVFKDVILGFVAGIQLSSNRMLAIGDWLEMPDYQADGDVEEIGLTTVKVRNFDRTITTIPTYALISQSFKNWRGMSESDGRRIKRSLLIDTNTIQLVTPSMVETFREIEHVAEYFRKKEEEVNEYNANLKPGRSKIRVNGRRLTNVGTFRAYIEGYLHHHPDINQKMTLLVRQLAPEGRGLPIEIYCFSANKDWGAYESIQADIFDHLLAVAPEFGLGIFQEPSGTDFQSAIGGEAGEE